MTCSSRLTSNGSAIEGWTLGGSVEDYEKVLQREHQGLQRFERSHNGL